MSSKYREFFESSKKNRPESKSDEQSLSFKDTYTLPGEVKRKEEIKREFKEYLEHPQESYNRTYIDPPFEASKVPSPVYGYNKPPRQRKKPTIDYGVLKQEMQKKPEEFLVLEEHATQSLKEKWGWTSESEPFSDLPDQMKIQKAKSVVREKTKKTYGLHRTLASIMDDDRNDSINRRSEVPGLFGKDDSGKR
ncbi:hypothetical protein [Alkalibacterium pelagium]|uniref:Uncharacterized protein n=1 Tax=Alkalibacterium pelagium TaxID=426702 RepID=A0A1H7ND19_9LACT|nr:hypothetical protein [Alkalibacterium pelagium]GEN51367.1 hypothetical protein APE02nite_20320 [Alkalibacterium pelagium]SEL21400.1 hypothetical protein SAMN04488099_11443 [Alkalibacterium pelagium]